MFMIRNDFSYSTIRGWGGSSYCNATLQGSDGNQAELGYITWEVTRVCTDTYQTSACHHQADASWVAPWYPVSGKLGNDMKMAKDNQIF